MRNDKRRYVMDPRKEMYAFGKEILRSEKFKKLATYRQHKYSNTYAHCIAVCLKALLFAKKMQIKVDVGALVKASLLHDYYLYDWHVKPHPKHHATRHPIIARENAMRDFGLSELEARAIESHMWPIAIGRYPTSREGWIICYADKCVAVNEVIMRKQEIERRELKKIKIRRAFRRLFRKSESVELAKGAKKIHFRKKRFTLRRSSI